MRTLRAFTTLTLVALVSLGLAACTSTTGRTAGENIDDATITSEVKTKLAAEKVSTLTKIGVDTDRRTVYLTGTVDNAEMRSRAEQIARSVKHVSSVVNNLTVKAQ
jgi:hyperosmotically inducible periplasmic protein